MIPLWMTVMSPGAVLVGMGVEVVRPAVGRPAGVGEADRGVRRPVGDRGLEVGELAGLLLDEQVAVLVDEGDPGRVVAAVLEPLEALDEDRPRLPGPGVADDSAHVADVSSASRGSDRRACSCPDASSAPSGVSLVARPRGPRSRRPARATSVGVRALDHDPQRGLRAGRPDEDPAAAAEPRLGVADRPLERRIALPLVLVAGPDRALLLGQERDPGGELGERHGRPGS